MTTEISEPQPQTLPAYVQDELANYEQQIRRYRAGELDETKMQKLRLHFGTYAQRQEGVQMQRIKIPGGVLSADQLVRLADAADRFGSGLYISPPVKMPRFITSSWKKLPTSCASWLRRASPLAKLRQHSAQHHRLLSRRHVGHRGLQCAALRRSVVSLPGAQQVQPKPGPEIQDHFRRLRRRSFGLANSRYWFMGCHRTRNGKLRRGFRVYLGGGLGAAPHLAHLYTDFLPVEELFNLAAAALRLFDRTANARRA